jgi:hypothetical protein
MKGAQNMPLDFSDYSDAIPPKTVAIVQMKLRYGDGTDNVLKPTRDGSGEGLDAELTLLDTEYAKRKFFSFILVVGETEGQKVMVERNLARLKQVIDSAKYLDPNDKSAEARAKRSLSWREFDGMRFLAEIGIEEGKNGYPDKNIIAKVITRDHPLWAGRPPIDQVAVTPSFGPPPTPAAPQAAPHAAPPIAKPPWAS